MFFYVFLFANQFFNIYALYFIFVFYNVTR